MSRFTIQKNKPLNEEIKYQNEKVLINNAEHPSQGKVVKKNSPLKTILITAAVLIAVAALVILILILSGVIKK